MKEIDSKQILSTGMSASFGVCKNSQHSSLENQKLNKTGAHDKWQNYSPPLQQMVKVIDNKPNKSRVYYSRPVIPKVGSATSWGGNRWGWWEP